jgi:predicted Zn-ribbon and HTH transcriptional regulator
MAAKNLPERSQTVREALHDELLRGPATARELSERAGVREKDVAQHLEHLEKSLRAKGEKLVVTPASCIACGFRFERRGRLSKPGSCPECGSTRIDPPAFAIESKGPGSADREGPGDG